MAIAEIGRAVLSGEEFLDALERIRSEFLAGRAFREWRRDLGERA